MTAAEVIVAFAGAWNARDDEERARLLDASCVPDAVFFAEQGPTAGVGALSAGIAEFRRTFPAAVVRFGVPDLHNGFARVGWATEWQAGQPVLGGTDFIQFAEDGRIRLLVSFDGTLSSEG
jgi:hypothetical protein